jgi:hypothetical protein
MITGTYRFQLSFAHVFPDPIVKEGGNNVELGVRPPKLKAEERPTIYNTVTFFEEDGVIKGIHQTELGKQKVDRVVYDDHTISWCAFSGSEGTDLWYYSMGYNEVTHQVAGIASGAAPFYRGYTLFYGEKI